jgi:nucleotide-binding universal stress UspA family protein
MDPLPMNLDRDYPEAEQRVQSLGEKATACGVSHCLWVEKGPVGDVLGSIIQRDNVDLLVLGTRSRGGLKKIALGSVAEEVLRLAPCPVLTIGPNVPVADWTKGIRAVLFATDFGPACVKAFSYALSLAEDYQAKLILLHMVPPVPIADLGPAVYCPGVYSTKALTQWQGEMRSESEKKLRALLPSNTKLAAEPECLVGTDFIPEGILNVAAADNVGLIVMGTNRAHSAKASAHIPWALTHEVIGHAKCPVLTVSNS